MPWNSNGDACVCREKLYEDLKSERRGCGVVLLFPEQFVSSVPDIGIQRILGGGRYSIGTIAVEENTQFNWSPYLSTH